MSTNPQPTVSMAGEAKEALWLKYKAESNKVDELYSAAKRAEKKAHALWLKWKRAKS